MTLIDDLRRVFKTSISFILKAVKIPRSTYYYTKHSQGRKYDDDQVIQAIDEIRQTDAKYTQDTYFVYCIVWRISSMA
ncbi:hypothetical protein [Limosilactobacillus fermentum]